MPRYGRSNWSIDKLVTRSLTYPRVVFGLWVCVAILPAQMLGELSIDTTIGSALDRTGPAWALYQKSLDAHGGDEFVTIALKPADVAYSHSTLADVVELTDRLDAIDGIRRVDSLASVPLIRSNADGALLVSPALSASAISSREGISQLAEYVAKDLIAPDSLVSADGMVFGLNLLFDDDVDGDRELAVGEIRAVLDEYPGALMSGVPLVRADAGRLTRSEIVRLVPVTVIGIAAFLLFSFGQARAVAPPLLVGAIGTLGCLGAMATAGVPLSFSTAVLPSVIFALSCAYCMHFLSAAMRPVGEGGLAEALCRVGNPVALSGATTSLGFLAMSSSEVQLISDLAVFGALGVSIATLASLTICPAALAAWPLNSGTRARLVSKVEFHIGPALVAGVLKHRALVLSMWIFVMLGSAIGVSRLTVSSDVIEWFPEEGELRQSYSEIRRRLSGITPVNVLITPPLGTSAVSPLMVAAIAEFSRELEGHEMVGKSLAVSDPLALVHREMVGAEGYSVPSTERLINQYMLLLDGVDQMDDVVSSGRDSANVLIRMNDNSSRAISEFATWAEDWWGGHGVPGSSVGVTGIMFEFARAQDAIALGGLWGLGIALITIGLLVAAFFRNVRLSLVTMVANAVPVVAIIGALGWMGIPLDAVTVCVASLSIGIAVDDSIHVVSEYRNAFDTIGSRNAALASSVTRVIPALVLTTIAVLIGFGALWTSSIVLVSHLGVMMCASVSVCLLADVTLLPALLALPRQRVSKITALLK